MKLFVYGTLKKGFRLNRYLDGELVAEGVLENYDMYTNANGYYPIITKGSGKVFGEIWEVTNKNFQTLDLIESEYDKVSEKIKTNDAEIECVVYTQSTKPCGCTQIDDGIFKMEDENI